MRVLTKGQVGAIIDSTAILEEQTMHFAIIPESRIGDGELRGRTTYKATGRPAVGRVVEPGGGLTLWQKQRYQIR